MKKLFKFSKNDFIFGVRYYNFNDFFGFFDFINNLVLYYLVLLLFFYFVFEGVDFFLEVIREKD